MPLYGSDSNATGNTKPKYANTSSVYGVTAAEAANTSGDGKKVAHAGWVQQSVGTGPISSIAINIGGAGYSNGFLTIGGTTGGTGANAAFTVNATGAITTITLNAGGSGFNAAPTISGTGVNTAIAQMTATLGGRGGRRFYETLVASGSISGNNQLNNTFFPG